MAGDLGGHGRRKKLSKGWSLTDGRNGWRPGWTWQGDDPALGHGRHHVVAMAGDLAGCSVRGSEKTPPRHRFSSMLKNVHVFQHP